MHNRQLTHHNVTSRRRLGQRGAVVGLLLLLGLSPFARVGVHAQERAADLAELRDLSLEELGAIEVTSVSKQPEQVWRTPVAITVVTRDQIRRSGRTSIPEILRMVPGVEVARIDSDHWSVGIRGLADQFAKSLLVLIDGRSLYTPLFAGTYWPEHDTLIEDIDRIEVIRGPGGTIWGADAVTGVINIITRPAADTHGTLASVTAGTQDRGIGSLRYGGSRGAHLDYRVYLKGFNRDGLRDSGVDPVDAWWMAQGGFRADWRPREGDVVTIQGDVSDGRHGQRVIVPTLVAPYTAPLDGQVDAGSANVLGRWERRLAGGGQIKLQAYVDWTSLIAPHFEEQRRTFDVDLVNGLRPLGRHRVSWGAGMRHSPGDFTQTLASLDFSPRSETNHVYSAFAQDEIDLVRERLVLTAGSKVEHNIYTGVEIQPSARLLWTPGRNTTFWAAASSAVRTPSRIERAIHARGFFALAASNVPVYLDSVGNDAFTAERLLGFESGFRTLVTPRVYFDVAAFRNRHRNLDAFGTATVRLETATPPVRAIATIPYVNGADGTSTGIEFAPDWRVAPWWQLDGSYAYQQFQVDMHTGTVDATARYEQSSPRHQAHLRSAMDLPLRLELELLYRFVSAIPARSADAYHSADVRFGWAGPRGLEIAVVGRDLLQPSHLEFGTGTAPGVPVSRSAAVTVTWRSRAEPAP